ncbi:MAG: hypothetical protein A2Y62_04380 [Candidatus Fischerbacteria bacterium RBG_13_37_8]|uniref:AAA+ ATPase domain-containing protein n=1 Tax=Candidatus Fischerbacteria bacterium RBG_13_37_8 TaxID=1817863 RepID=A0A1F5VXW4_9BACT|nr:MAG: hypothetical protein A2Y62_04380 [Candidatus Fischerbacteria bacterium RBG_13_37_8]
MIKPLFGFTTNPFAKDIDSKKIYMSASMKELFSRLEYMQQTRGLMLLTGEPGVGKTIAIRAFIESLNPSMYYCMYIPLSTVSNADFYRQLCFQLTGEYSYRKAACFHNIQSAITDLVKNNKKVPLIVVDECHLLKPENLYEIQIILNFDLDSTDPVIFIMIGQTHLRDVLSRQVHRALNQRFSLKYALQPLDKTEAREYLLHHLKVAGCKNNIFNDAAIDAIYSNAMGNPREMGSLAWKAIMVAAAEKKQIVTEEDVYCVSKELRQ